MIVDLMLNRGHKEKLVSVTLKAPPLQDHRPTLGRRLRGLSARTLSWWGWVFIAFPCWSTPSSPWVTLSVWPTGERFPDSTYQKLPGPEPVIC